MLAPDTTLGPYTIRELLAAGGMGEVYRATDGRLHREVAIKVLPRHLAEDRIARDRFGREARAVASLSHPNILAIFDVGEEDGVHYAVTELLEGITLRTRLRDSLTADEAIELMLQIADGVGAAHRQGLIHRDLKPENIFITASGRVKVLDFGLARQSDNWLRPSSEFRATEVLPTQPGTVIGTVGYLAPEQIEARPTSPATDVFALGCLLYEVFEGDTPFAGATPAHSLALVLTGEFPPLESEGAALIGPIVRKCLARDPEHRYRDAGELAAAIRSIPGGVAAATRATQRVVLPLLERPTRRSWIAVAVVAAAGAGFAGYRWYGATNVVIDDGYAVRAGDIRADGETRDIIARALSADSLGDRTKAITLLEEAHRRSRETALPAAYLSSWSGGAGDTPAERRWAAEAMRRLDGGESPFESLLVRFLASTQPESGRVLALANSIVELRPEAWRCRLAAAHILLQRRENVPALRHLQQIDVSKPDDRRLALVLADRASLGDIDGAERDLARSRLARRPALHVYTRARIAWSRGNVADAHNRYLTAATTAGANNQRNLEVECLTYAGLASVRLRDWGTAQAELARAHSRARELGLVLRQFDTAALAAWAAFQEGDPGERDRKFEEARRFVEHPGDVASLRLLAIRSGSTLWRQWPRPETGAIAILPGVASLIEAAESFQNGDPEAARLRVRRARREGIDSTGLREETELLAARLGEPAVVLRPDPPYPTVLRFLAIFDLEEMRQK